MVMFAPGRLHTTFVGSHSSRALTLVSLTPPKRAFLSIPIFKYLYPSCSKAFPVLSTSVLPFVQKYTEHLVI